MAHAGFDDVTLAHGTNVLRFLDERRGSHRTLASLSGLSKQALSQQVKYLEAHGYVSVGPDPTDQRSKLVRNTTRGWDCRTVARPSSPTSSGAGQSAVWGLPSSAELRAALEAAVAVLAP